MFLTISSWIAFLALPAFIAGLISYQKKESDPNFYVTVVSFVVLVIYAIYRAAGTLFF